LEITSNYCSRNVLAAAYPDLFTAGIAYSGVPAGCFVSASNGVNAWNGTCSGGQSHKSEREWGQIAKNMYPGYSGPRPRMQIYHGGADKTLASPNYEETIKQWCGVFGYDYSRPQSKTNGPGAGYTTTIYGPNLQGIYAAGIGHNLPIHASLDMQWFGLR
jgi:acetylxylan esterase